MSHAPVVLTITPNPSVDLLFEAERLVWDDANRTPLPRRRPGGQGLNVVRALHALGGRGAALALLGGAAGAELEAMLLAERIELHRVPAEGDTRVFVAARERATGRSLLLNPRGPPSSGVSGDALCSAAHEYVRAHSPRWVACCGSVPPGIGLDLYARIGADARAQGARFVADCDGELLRLALDAGCDLLVPNEHEAARLSGRSSHDVADAGRVAGALCARGVDVACVTLAERGAVLAGRSGCWHASAPPQHAGSAVGAGDAFLAALLLGLEAGAVLPEVLRGAVAAGAAVLKSAGGDLLTEEEYRRQLARVELTPL